MSFMRRIGIKNSTSSARGEDTEKTLPRDTLRPESIHPQFLQHVGFPETADAVVYDPIQGLLAISTSDGLVKLIGQRGVEATLLTPPNRSKNAPSPSSPTLELQFLQHRGALLRVCKDASIQLFSIPGRRLLSSLTIDDKGVQVVNAVSLIPRSPYILLGCESGDCQVVRIASRNWKDTSPTQYDVGGVSDSGRDASNRYYSISTSKGRGGGETAIAIGKFETDTATAHQHNREELEGHPEAQEGEIEDHDDECRDRDRDQEESKDDNDNEDDDEDMMPAARLVLQPYMITKDDVQGVGGVVGLAVALKATDSEEGEPYRYRQLAVIVHRDSGVTVRDLRAEKNICIARDESDDPSKPTATCWVGDRANCFAVGYDDGSVLVFGIPSEALSAASYPAKSQKNSNRPVGSTVSLPMDAVLLLSVRIVPESEKAAPIRKLTFLAGDPGARGAEDRLLVCGGQRIQDPEMLTLVLLEQQEQGCTTNDAANQTIPWFGALKAHTVMRPTPLDPPALMLLTQGGQLVVHDLEDWQPYPLTMPLQELPPITVVKFVPLLPQPAMTGGDCNSRNAVVTPLTLSALYAVAGQSAKRSTDAAADWPFTGGEPAPNEMGKSVESLYHPSALLFSGHRDGRVRVWDVTTQVPTLLATVPGLKATSGTFVPVRAVTCLDVCPMSGLLAVGHGNSGEARLYRFSPTTQAVKQVFLDESLVPYDKVTTQQPGFHYILKYSGTHDGDCTAISLSSRYQLLAVGDGSGMVSVVDLSNAHRLCTLQPFPGKACAKLALGCISQQANKSVALFAACLDSTVSMSVLPIHHWSNMGLSENRSFSQEPVYSALQTPPSRSKTLDLQLLNAQGLPLFPTLLSIPSSLKWASLERRVKSDNVHKDHDRVQQEVSTESKDGMHNYHTHGPLGRGILAPAHGLSSFIRRRRRESQGEIDPAGKPMSNDTDDNDDDDDITLDEIDTTADLFGESTARMEGSSMEGSSMEGSSMEADGGLQRFKQSDEKTSDFDHRATGVVSHNNESDFNYNDDNASEDTFEVCYVMVATTSFVRLYDIRTPVQKSVKASDNVHPVLSVRKTLNLSVDVLGGGTAGFCGAFMTAGAGAGLMVVSSDIPTNSSGKSNRLAVLSIPNMVLADACPLQDVVGFPLPSLKSSENSLDGTMLAMSHDGQLLFVTSASELVRVAVAEDTVYPNGAASTFNWEMAKAARALEVESRRNTGDSVPKVGFDLPAAAARGGSFLYKTVRGAAAGLVEGATAEIERLRAYAPTSAANSSMKTSHASTSYNPLYPPLHSLFRSRPTGDKELLKVVETDTEGSRTTLPPTLQPDATPPTRESGLAREKGKKGGIRRTASEIKRVYGHSRAQDARATLERTREMLGERGEKLSQLEEKAAAIRNDAEDFASVAADLEKSFKNRSWWNL